jgi:hypothetical protein
MFWTIFLGVIAAIVTLKLFQFILGFLEQQSMQATLGPGPNYAEMSRKLFTKRQIERLEKFLLQIRCFSFGLICLSQK